MNFIEARLRAGLIHCVRRDLPFLVLIAAMLALSALAWSPASKRVPTDWGFAGRADAPRPKTFGPLMIPATAAGMLLFLRLLHSGQRHPSRERPPGTTAAAPR